MTRASRDGAITSFEMLPGRTIGGKYVVEKLLGRGWEGEVYKVLEQRTGVTRAAKLFFPHRNPRDRAVTFYARKLERLRDCPIIIKYHHSETLRQKGHAVTALISEFVEGELLDDMVARSPGRRFQPFEALHVLYALASGLEQVHGMREYHGDMHQGNILVRRSGVFFDVKLVDLYHWGRPSAANIREDVINLINVFHDLLGGRKRYASLPPEVKGIILGRRRDLIAKRFPTAKALRKHLERFEWSG